MKYFHFLIIIFLFPFYLCKETNIINNKEEEDPSINKDDLEEKEVNIDSKKENLFEKKKKTVEENDKKFKEKVFNMLKELGLENKKKITTEQFKKLFFKLLEVEQKKEKDEKNEDNLDNDESMFLFRGFANQIFDQLVDPKIKNIEVDKIFDYLDPKKMLDALKEILKEYGMEKLIDTFSGPLLESFPNSFSENDNNDPIEKEKNNDL